MSTEDSVTCGQLWGSKGECSVWMYWHWCMREPYHRGDCRCECGTVRL